MHTDLDCFFTTLNHLIRTPETGSQLARMTRVDTDQGVEIRLDCGWFDTMGCEQGDKDLHQLCRDPTHLADCNNVVHIRHVHANHMGRLSAGAPCSTYKLIMRWTCGRNLGQKDPSVLERSLGGRLCDSRPNPIHRLVFWKQQPTLAGSSPTHHLPTVYLLAMDRFFNEVRAPS